MGYKEETLLQDTSEIKDEKLRVGIVYFHTRAKLLVRSTKDLGEARKLADGRVRVLNQMLIFVEPPDDFTELSG